jgi:hypothetical protein
MWHDSIVCVARLIHTCDMTFICVTWLIPMCDMTHSYVWRDSFISVIWLMHACDMTHSYVWQDSRIQMTWLIQKRCVRVIWLMESRPQETPDTMPWLTHTHTYTHIHTHTHKLPRPTKEMVTPSRIGVLCTCKGIFCLFCTHITLGVKWWGAQCNTHYNTQRYSEIL